MPPLLLPLRLPPLLPPPLPLPLLRPLLPQVLHYREANAGRLRPRARGGEPEHLPWLAAAAALEGRAAAAAAGFCARLHARPRVHAGFQKGWLQNGFNRRLLEWCARRHGGGEGGVDARPHGGLGCVGAFLGVWGGVRIMETYKPTRP